MKTLHAARRFFTFERLIILTIAILVSSTIAVLVTGFVAVQPEQRSLGNYESPQKVLNRVPSLDHPAALAGEPIRIYGVRCVNRDGINVLSIRSFVETRVAEPRTAQAETMVAENITRPANACGPREISSPILMPSAVEGGWWKITAISISLTDGEIRFWESEEFEVIHRP